MGVCVRVAPVLLVAIPGVWWGQGQAVAWCFSWNSRLDDRDFSLPCMQALFLSSSSQPPESNYLIGGNFSVGVWNSGRALLGKKRPSVCLLGLQIGCY